MSAPRDPAPQEARAADRGERRRWTRVPVAHLGAMALLVPEALAPCTMLGRVRDVAPGGCCVVVPALVARPLTVGERCTVLFPAPTGCVRLRVTLVAVDAETEGADDVRLHLSFDSADTETPGGATLWAALTHWMRALSRDVSP